MSNSWCRAWWAAATEPFGERQKFALMASSWSVLRSRIPVFGILFLLKRDCFEQERLSLKIQGAFFDRVSVAHHQDRDETEHAPKNNAALLNGIAVYHRPWVHEHDLDVE